MVTAVTHFFYRPSGQHPEFTTSRYAASLLCRGRQKNIVMTLSPIVRLALLGGSACCAALTAFRKRDKPAIVIEYTNVRRKMDADCAAAQELDLQVVFKTKSLNGKIHRRCP